MFIVHAEEYMQKGKKLPLGRQGENLARCISYDFSEMVAEFGEGVFQWVCRRPSEEMPYICTNTAQVDYLAYLNLTNVETGKYGQGELELRYYVSDVLCKTIVWNTIITKSLQETGEIPDPYQDIIEKVAQDANKARIAADEAKEAADHFVIEPMFSGDSVNAVQNKIVKGAFDAVNGRIDNLIIEGQTIDPNAELIDIRTGYEGTQYQTAGTAVREQVGNLHDDLIATKAEIESNVNTLLDGKVADGYVEEGVAYFTNSDNEVLFTITGIGGGGGGGGGSESHMEIHNESDWSSTSIAVGGRVSISFSWLSTVDEMPTGDGTLVLYVNNAVRSTRNVSQGIVTVDVTDYMALGTNQLRAVVTDAYGQSKKLIYTVVVAEYTLSGNVDELTPKTGSFILYYVPRGNAEKTMHFLVDGKEIGTAVTTVSGRQQSYTIPAQTHGDHVVQAYFVAELNGQTVKSNELYFDVKCLEEGNTTPIIATNFRTDEVEQYTTINIAYSVYDPSNLTAAVKYYANDELVSEQTVDRNEQNWTFRADVVGELKLKIKVGNVQKEFTINVTESSVTAKVTTEDMVLSLQATGRSNNEQNPAVWTYKDIACTFSGFNWKSDGWQTDSEGSTALRVAGDARLSIPYKPFEQDFRTTGKTIEIEFETRDVLNYDSPILTCMDGGRGIQLTAQNAVFASEQSSMAAQYKENERVRLSIVVEKRTENRLIYVYIDGVMSGVIQYPTDDDFSQQTPHGISIGSNLCTMDIYSIRIYDNSLTRHQILDNFIADTQSVDTMLTRYGRNNIFDEYDNIVISKLPSDLPYMIVTCPQLPQYKGDKKTCSVTFVNPKDPTKNYTAVGVQIDVQGTSSQYYERKNYKMKYKNGFTINGTESETYKMRSDSIPTSTFTMKADVASSEGANNVELARLYNDTCPYSTPSQVLNGDVRQGIDGFPCVIFWNDGSDTIFLGKYNFNNDKGTEEVFGFVPDDESWEIKNNTSDRVVWKNDDYSGTDWLNDFEARFPDTDPAYTDATQLAEFAAWAKSTDRTQATGNALAESVTYNGVTYTTDSADYRLAKFKAEASQYMEMNSAIYYYLFTELFLMVDSRAKNAFPSFMGSSAV